MDSKLMENLSKALIGVGLGYLAYAVATMPKELQQEVKHFAEQGLTDKIKLLTDKQHTDEREEEYKFIHSEV